VSLTSSDQPGLVTLILFSSSLTSGFSSVILILKHPACHKLN
jgi:hypothetical protein